MITKTRSAVFRGGPYDGIEQVMFSWENCEFPASLSMPKHPNMKPTLDSIQKACSGESTCNFVDYKYSGQDFNGSVIYKFVEGAQV